MTAINDRQRTYQYEANNDEGSRVSFAPLYVLSMDTSFGQARSCIIRLTHRIPDIVVKGMEATLNMRHKSADARWKVIYVRYVSEGAIEVGVRTNG